MSEYADKHSKAHRKERVDHILGSTKGKVDASGYEVPGEMDTEKKTGPCQPKPRAFAKGGKVEGHKAHHHAGRKSRAPGGETSVQQLRPQVPTGGLYGSGFSPTHAGMLSNAAGLKKGGEAKRYKRDSGGGVEGEAVKQAKANSSYQKARDAEGNASFLTAPFKEQDTQSAMNRMGRTSGQTGYDAEYKRGGEAKGRKARAEGGPAGSDPRAKSAKYNQMLDKRQNDENSHADFDVDAVPGGYNDRPQYMKDARFARGGDTKSRKARAEGGRAKGKTNINIIIGSPKEAGPGVPPPPSAMPPPPRPGLPPAAMGAMSGPPGAMGGPGGLPPGMPPHMPPGMGSR